MTKSIVILAGGASSRMKKSLTVEGLSEAEVKTANTSSKALITFGKANRPVLDALIKNAENTGFEEIYLVIGSSGGDFKSFYAEEITTQLFPKLTFHFAVQHIPEHRTTPLGTADALLQCLEQFPELKKGSFVVCNSDNLYSEKALRLLREASETNALISYDRDALLFASERIARFAIVKLDAQDHMIQIVEKPESSDLISLKDSEGKLRVSMNIWKLNGEDIFKFLRDCPIHTIRNEKELPVAIQNMISSTSIRVKAFSLEEHVPDLTSKEDIKTFKKYLE
jgi:NDP-sugar pyrophosphorylase family protein